MTDSRLGPARYTKRPLTIEAMQFTGGNADAIRAWMFTHVKQVGHPSVWFFTRDESKPKFVPGDKAAAVYDYLHKTWVGLDVDDMIIKGVAGEFYPHAADLFSTAYDRAVDDLEPTALQHRFLTALRTLALATFEHRGRGSGTSTALRMGAALLNNLAEIDLGQDPPDNLAPGLAETYRGTLLGDAEWTDTEEQP